MGMHILPVRRKNGRGRDEKIFAGMFVVEEVIWRYIDSGQNLA
jgi:hypothetical protein